MYTITNNKKGYTLTLYVNGKATKTFNVSKMYQAVYILQLLKLEILDEHASLKNCA